MCDKHVNEILYEIRDFYFATYFHYGIIRVYHPNPRVFWFLDMMNIYHESDGDRKTWWIYLNILQVGLVDYYYWIVLQQKYFSLF